MIGPYEIRGELGRGAMAVVWRGFDPRLEREVAIKEPVLPAGLPEGAAAEMGARFVREGLAAARLNHPGIITVFTADVFDGRPAIVMERIDGGTLHEALRSGPLAPAVAESILDQLLDAIGFAHGRGIVHRDIKPENIFLTADGRVKLADFGIAHVEAQQNMTQAGTVLGTPGYMSPEQVTGMSTDARSDIFSVGVVAHEMLTGRNPFGIDDGDNPTAVMYRIVHEDTPELASFVPGVPPRLSEVVRIALAKDPAFRFASAGAMREALRGGAVMVGGAPATVGSTPYGTGPMPAQVWAPAGAQPKRNSGPWVYLGVGAAGVVVTIALIIAATSGGTAGGPVAVSGAQGTPAAETAAASVPAAPAATPPQPTEAELRAELDAAFDQWLSAWRSRDYGAYISFYASDFLGAQNSYDGSSKTRGLSEWASWKSGVFSERRFQTVEPSERFTELNGTSALIGFNQYFEQDSSSSSGVYRDFGYKEMDWAYRNGRWQITREDWDEGLL